MQLTKISTEKKCSGRCNIIMGLIAAYYSCRNKRGPGSSRLPRILVPYTSKLAAWWTNSNPYIRHQGEEPQVDGKAPWQMKEP